MCEHSSTTPSRSTIHVQVVIQAQLNCFRGLKFNAARLEYSKATRFHEFSCTLPQFKTR